MASFRHLAGQRSSRDYLRLSYCGICGRRVHPSTAALFLERRSAARAASHNQCSKSVASDSQAVQRSHFRFGATSPAPCPKSSVEDMIAVERGIPSSSCTSLRHRRLWPRHFRSSPKNAAPPDDGDLSHASGEHSEPLGQAIGDALPYIMYLCIAPVDRRRVRKCRTVTSKP